MNISKIKQNYIVNLTCILTIFYNDGSSKIDSISNLELDNTNILPNLLFTHISNLVKEKFWDLPAVMAYFHNKLDISYGNFTITVIAKNELFNFDLYRQNLYDEFELIRYY